MSKIEQEDRRAQKDGTAADSTPLLVVVLLSIKGYYYPTHENYPYDTPNNNGWQQTLRCDG